MGKKQIPILILHGWNLSGHTFQPLVSELKKQGYAVYAPDLPGFGSSGVPEKPLMLGDYVDFVVGYMTSYNIGQAVVIGHSFGGRVGIKLATRCPELVKTLVLTGAPGFRSERRGLRLWIERVSKIGAMIGRVPPLSMFFPVLRDVWYGILGVREFGKARGTMKQTFVSVVSESLVPYMKQIRVPTLLLWGSDDSTVPRQIAYKMNTLIAVSVYREIVGAGHGVPYQKPREFAEEMIKYL